MSPTHGDRTREYVLAEQARQEAKAARKQRVADLWAEAARLTSERIAKERNDMTNDVLTSIREQTARNVNAGQKPAEAAENATRAYFITNPDAKIDEATFESLPLSVQATYVNTRIEADPSGELFAEGPETPAMVAARHRKGILTNEETAEALAAINQEFADKRLAKIVGPARAEHQAAIEAYVQRGGSREAAQQTIQLDQFLPEPAQGETRAGRLSDITAYEERAAQVTTDWFKVGSDDDAGEAE